MQDYFLLSKKVSQWRLDRGIDDFKSQLLKVHEELTELKQAITREEGEEKIKMEMGDVMVASIILADILGLNEVDCLEMAYNKIKNRTGKTVNKDFIKEL